MKFLLTCTVALATLAASFAIKPTGYTITGTVTGLPDSTWLYLYTTRPNQLIDSCMVTQGTFTMHGRIHDKAAEVYLITKYPNYVKFWLENSNISIQIKADSFKQAVISGSVTQEEQKSLDALCSGKQFDSLNTLLKTTKDTLVQKQIRQQRGTLQEQAQLDWIKAHPNSFATVNLINMCANSWGREKVQALYNYLSQDMKATRLGCEISDFIALHQNIKVGDKYEDFELPNTKGKMVKLSKVKEKYTLLEFWASLCGGCRKSNPALVSTYTRFKDKGFAVLGVSLDEVKADWLQAVAKDQLPWENVSDLRGAKNKVALLYGVTDLPGNFLIDEQGIIIAKDLRGKALDDKLEQLLP